MDYYQDSDCSFNQFYLNRPTMLNNNMFSHPFQQSELQDSTHNSIQMEYRLEDQYSSMSQPESNNFIQDIQGSNSPERTLPNTPMRTIKIEEQLRKKQQVANDKKMSFLLFEQNPLITIKNILNLSVESPLSIVPLKQKVPSQKKVKREMNDHSNEIMEIVEVEVENEFQDIPLKPQYYCDKCDKQFSTSTGLGGHNSKVHRRSSEKYNKKIQTQKKNEVKRNRRDILTQYLINSLDQQFL